VQKGYAIRLARRSHGRARARRALLPPGGAQDVRNPSQIRGAEKLVDPYEILAIDICREMFASGTLKLQLTDRQTLKVLEVESTPGSVGASKAASAFSDIDKANVDAKKAKKDAAAGTTDDDP
jgi:hypothetical protein